MGAGLSRAGNDQTRPVKKTPAAAAVFFTGLP